MRNKNVKNMFFSLVIMLMFMEMFITPVEASAGKNLKDGLTMIVSSPKRIGQKVAEEYELEDFKPLGIAVGCLKGFTYTVTDILIGTARVLTFPINFNSQEEDSSWSDYLMFEGDVLSEK